MDLEKVSLNHLGLGEEKEAIKALKHSKTQKEIDRLTIPVYLHESDRFEHIITQGTEDQRNFILAGLSAILVTIADTSEQTRVVDVFVEHVLLPLSTKKIDGDVPSAIPHILQALEYCVQTSRITLTNTVIQTLLHIIASDEISAEQLVHSGKILCSAIIASKEKVLIADLGLLVEELGILANDAMHPYRRQVAGYLACVIYFRTVTLHKLDAEKRDSLLQIIRHLCQDTEPFVRQAMAQSMGPISIKFTAMPPHEVAEIENEWKQLLIDEDIDTQTTSIRQAILFKKFLSARFLDTIVYPVIHQILSAVNGGNQVNPMKTFDMGESSSVHANGKFDHTQFECIVNVSGQRGNVYKTRLNDTIGLLAYSCATTVQNHSKAKPDVEYIAQSSLLHQIKLSTYELAWSLSHHASSSLRIQLVDQLQVLLSASSLHEYCQHVLPLAHRLARDSDPGVRFTMARCTCIITVQIIQLVKQHGPLMASETFRLNRAALFEHVSDLVITLLSDPHLSASRDKDGAYTEYEGYNTLKSPSLLNSYGSPVDLEHAPIWQPIYAALPHLMISISVLSDSYVQRRQFFRDVLLRASEIFMATKVPRVQATYLSILRHAMLFCDHPSVTDIALAACIYCLNNGAKCIRVLAIQLFVWISRFAPRSFTRQHTIKYITFVIAGSSKASLRQLAVDATLAALWIYSTNFVRKTFLPICLNLLDDTDISVRLYALSYIVHIIHRLGLSQSSDSLSSEIIGQMIHTLFTWQQESQSIAQRERILQVLKVLTNLPDGMHSAHELQRQETLQQTKRDHKSLNLPMQDAHLNGSDVTDPQHHHHKSSNASKRYDEDIIHRNSQPSSSSTVPANSQDGFSQSLNANGNISRTPGRVGSLRVSRRTHCSSSNSETRAPSVDNQSYSIEDSNQVSNTGQHTHRNRIVKELDSTAKLPITRNSSFQLDRSRSFKISHSSNSFAGNAAHGATTPSRKSVVRYGRRATDLSHINTFNTTNSFTSDEPSSAREINGSQNIAKRDDGELCRMNVKDCSVGNSLTPSSSNDNSTTDAPGPFLSVPSRSGKLLRSRRLRNAKRVAVPLESTASKEDSFQSSDSVSDTEQIPEKNCAQSERKLQRIRVHEWPIILPNGQECVVQKGVITSCELPSSLKGSMMATYERACGPCLCKGHHQSIFRQTISNKTEDMPSFVHSKYLTYTVEQRLASLQEATVTCTDLVLQLTTGTWCCTMSPFFVPLTVRFVLHTLAEICKKIPSYSSPPNVCPNTPAKSCHWGILHNPYEEFLFKPEHQSSNQVSKNELLDNEEVEMLQSNIYSADSLVTVLSEPAPIRSSLSTLSVSRGMITSPGMDHNCLYSGIREVMYWASPEAQSTLYAVLSLIPSGDIHMFKEFADINFCASCICTTQIQSHFKQSEEHLAKTIHIEDEARRRKMIEKRKNDVKSYSMRFARGVGRPPLSSINVSNSVNLETNDPSNKSIHAQSTTTKDITMVDVNKTNHNNNPRTSGGYLPNTKSFRRASISSPRSLSEYADKHKLATRVRSVSPKTSLSRMCTSPRVVNNYPSIDSNTSYLDHQDKLHDLSHQTSTGAHESNHMKHIHAREKLARRTTVSKDKWTRLKSNFSDVPSLHNRKPTGNISPSDESSISTPKPLSSSKPFSTPASRAGSHILKRF